MADTSADPVDNSDTELPADTGLDFECPRCGSEVTAAFYGPCDSCRSALRTTIRADATEVAAADYEPKMNVTPNAVALKE